jgi:hypothetical protein
MVGQGLTESDVLEIVYKSDASLSDSSNDSISSSNKETDKAAEHMQLWMIKVIMKKKYCIKNSYGRPRITTQDTEKYLVVILDPDLVQKM